jgi:hypothetical protein
MKEWLEQYVSSFYVEYIRVSTISLATALQLPAISYFIHKSIKLFQIAIMNAEDRSNQAAGHKANLSNPSKFTHFQSHTQHDAHSNHA